MRGDLQVIGPQATLNARIAASATRVESGEPIHQASLTNTSGAASANVFTLAAADTCVIGTDLFGGVAVTSTRPWKTGTVTAQIIQFARPVAWCGKIEGNAETAASVDTDAELLAIMEDNVLIDYNSTGGADDGELYTIQETASADTSAFTITGGDVSKGTLQVTVDGRAYRVAVS